MLMQQTLDILRKMRLFGLVESYLTQTQQSDSGSLSFEERLSIMVDHEWTLRQNHTLAQNLKQSKLRLTACLEDIDFLTPRGLNKSVLLNFRSCGWIRNQQNILLTGPTGVGKTFIACALGNAACRENFKVRYYRVPRLLSDLNVAKADGSYSKFFRRLVKMDLLILDDWGLAPLTSAEGRDMLEIIEERYQLRSNVLVSQLPVEHWHEVIGDPSIADAILDRIVHNAHRIEMKGESMRKLKNSTKNPE
jgi:DNA replication protein DnaC